MPLALANGNLQIANCEGSSDTDQVPAIGNLQSTICNLKSAIRITLPRQSPEAKLKNPTCKRGALYGNQNALKHGFYARAFKAGEMADLDAVLTDGLNDEITMLRLATRRVIDCVGEFTTPTEAIAILGALGLAATRLATLLRTQKILDGQEQNTNLALSQALGDVIRELGINST